MNNIVDWAKRNWIWIVVAVVIYFVLVRKPAVVPAPTPAA